MSGQRPSLVGMPWRLVGVVGPLAAVAVVVATAIGVSDGRTAATEHLQGEMGETSRSAAPTPSAMPREPFVSSMPRPTTTKLDESAEPTTVTGQRFDSDQQTRTLSPDVPFAFRVPAGGWKTKTSPPERDMVYSEAYSRPTGNETAATSPLRVVFGWRACGACTADDVPEFDKRFHAHFDTPPFSLEGKDETTAYQEIRTDTKYYLVVRHLFESPDGNTYLIDYMTQATNGDEDKAQQLANEILSQTSR